MCGWAGGAWHIARVQRVCSCAHSRLLPPSSLHPAAPPHRCPAAPPAGNIFEGDWKEGKPQLKDTKSKDWANLLPWLNETVTLTPNPNPHVLPWLNEMAPTPLRRNSP